MDEQKQERDREQNEESERAGEGSEIEEHGFRVRFRDESGSEEGSSEEGERGEQDKRVSDLRLKTQARRLSSALSRIQ